MIMMMIFSLYDYLQSSQHCNPQFSVFVYLHACMHLVISSTSAMYTHHHRHHHHRWEQALFLL